MRDQQEKSSPSPYHHASPAKGGEEKILDDRLNRREFLLATLQATGALALASVAGRASALPGARQAGFSGRRVGISDAAYQSAFMRAEKLVEQMTLDEKIAQTGNEAPAIERLGVPAYNYYSGEALHGLCWVGPATSFPVPLALAASWNPDLFHRVYAAVGDEARAFDNRDHIGLSYYSPPTLNLHRDPRWGRCAESPGEDPCLASTVAVQVVRGMQGDDPRYLKTTACSKHFICNNTDDDRTAISATVDPRSFWEYYTRAYRATLLDGDVFTFMSAYSAINGVPCSANPFLLTELLRERWGFRGYVTSDCDAVFNVYDPHHYAPSLPAAAGMSVKAGCDVDCGGTLPRHLGAAVAQGLIDENAITLAVTRLFTVRYLLGLFDPPGQVPYKRIPFSVVDSPAHRALALEAARQSLVLLKNNGGFLPLHKHRVKNVAVIGPMADSCYLGGYSGSPAVRISPAEGIARMLGVTIARPYISMTDVVDSGGGARLLPSSEGGASIGFIRDGSWAQLPKVDFTGKTEIRGRVASATQGGRIDIHLDSLTGPIACTLTVAGTGGWENWVDVHAPISGISGRHAIFLAFHGGPGYLLNVGPLELAPLAPEPAPAPGQPHVVVKTGCTVTGDRDDTLFREAVDAARKADLVVLVCGVNDEVDTEGHDRRSIGLTGAQPELIQAVYAANPRTVLVLSTNNSVAVEWEEKHLPAILCAVCAGQAQGTAIAEALFGEYNPGGKLPCTWYRSTDQLPDFHDYDIAKGRTYMYFEGDPLYPFGHGLSYTTFHMERLEIGSHRLGPGEKVSISLGVTNTGPRAGAEVAQLYLAPPQSQVKRPIKQLVGFQRVELQPGESKRVVFELPHDHPALWYWNEADQRFVCQPGTAKVLVGSSSANILLSGELALAGASRDQHHLSSGVAVHSTVL